MGDPRRAEALYRAGAEAQQQGQEDQAASLLEQACQVDGGHAAAHHLLGKLLRSRGDAAGAELLQRRSCELDPGLGWNWFALAELLQARGHHRQAAEAFARAHQILIAELWIADLVAEAQLQADLGGERLEDGLGPRGYQLWIEQLEVRPAAAVARLQQRWWLQPPPADACDGWVVLLAEDARLRPGALQALEQRLALWSGDLPDLLYTDEDRIDASGQRHDPWFKPGWVPESFWSTPWLDGFSAWRLSWLRHAGLPLPPQKGTGRFAWQLAALAQRPRIGHVDAVLVHRAGVPEAASVARAQLLMEHLAVLGEPGVQVCAGQEPVGSYRLQWPLPAAQRCRVVIPSRDHADLLAQCLGSVLATTQGLELEIMVVDNGSQEAGFEALLQQWRDRLGASFLSLRDDSAFNWSRLNNRGAAGASTDLLLFLNNDIEADRPGWCEAMAAQALRPAIGCVGALLRYPDGSLQHGGVVVGMHGGADHAYRGLDPHHGVHRARSRCLSGWGAVTGACLMVRRDLFERVRGFDPALPVEFNDIEFCLRLGQLGYRHVIPPEASLVHHESQSRDASGSRTAAPALRRMQALWGPRLADPAPWWPASCEPHHADGRPLGLGTLSC